MFVPMISLVRRKGGGKGGSNPKGTSSKSPGSGGGGKPQPVAISNDFPKGHKEAKTYGKGGGKPLHIKSGILQGWSIGGGKRGPQVYGNTFHPTVPPPKTLPWAFWPITISFYIYTVSDAGLRNFNQSLPQNLTRPGGELHEMKITPSVNGTISFFLVSDNFTIYETRDTINTTCGSTINASFSDPILVNSTGNIQPGNLVQFYRGDSAAMFLQGYNNTGERPGAAVPNPPFPSGANLNAWKCFNETIGTSIPLFENKASKGLAIGLGVGLTMFVICAFVAVICISSRRSKRRG